MCCIATYLGGCEVNRLSTLDDFSESPTKSRYEALRRGFHADRQSCSEIGAYAEKPVERLIDEISRGNEIAFRGGLLLFRCWDGGSLEDFFASSGAFFDLSPDAFFQAVDEFIVWRYELERMIVALPETTIDDIEAQRQLLQRRKGLLSSQKNRNADWLNAALDELLSGLPDN